MTELVGESGEKTRERYAWMPIAMLVRRCLLLWALMFWQGGFTFYGGVVVPVGTAVLGSGEEQGFITRSVTNYLNLAGAVALAFWGWDLIMMRRTSRVGNRLRWTIWAGLVLSLIVLVWMHMRLDELLVPAEGVILDRHRFHALHERYLIVSTVQWAACLSLTAMTVWAWRGEDAGRVSGV